MKNVFGGERALNRQFMEKIYKGLYGEDPVHAVMKGNGSYLDYSAMRIELQEKFQELTTDEMMALHEKIVDNINLQNLIVAREMYLKGMEDREKMLQL